MKRAILLLIVIIPLWFFWWSMSPQLFRYSTQLRFLEPHQERLVVEEVHWALAFDDMSVKICAEAIWQSRYNKNPIGTVTLNIPSLSLLIQDDVEYVLSRFSMNRLTIQDDQVSLGCQNANGAQIDFHQMSSDLTVRRISDIANENDSWLVLWRPFFSHFAVVSPFLIRVVEFPKWPGPVNSDETEQREERYVVYRLPEREVLPEPLKGYLVMPLAVLLDSIMGPLQWFIVQH